MSFVVDKCLKVGARVELVPKVLVARFLDGHSLTLKTLVSRGHSSSSDVVLVLPSLEYVRVCPRQIVFRQSVHVDVAFEVVLGVDRVVLVNRRL